MTASDILLWLGETSLAVSILIALVLVLRRPFSQYFGARAAYALWLAPVIRLFLPELSILPRPEMAKVEPVVWTYDTVAVTAASIASPAFDFGAFFAAAGLLIWAIVAIAWFSMKLETQSRFIKARLAASKAASPALIDEARMAAKSAGLKKLPQIRVSEDTFGPAVIGLFRPVMFLPAVFETNYSLKERRLALAHELAHIARGDMATQLAAFAFQAAQWPNPLVHFAVNAFRTDQEAACDAYVMARCKSDERAAGDYASAILKSACGGAAPAYGLSLGHPVKERLMLLKSKHSPVRLLAGAAAVALISAGGLAATASYGYAAAPKDKVEVKTKTNAGDVKTKSISKTVIELDDGESFKIDGIKNADKAAKIEITEENNEQTVRVYDKKGKLLSEDKYGPDDELPFGMIIVKTKDGEERTIKLRPISTTHKVKFIGEDGDGKNVHVVIDALGDHDVNFTSTDGETFLIKAKEGNVHKQRVQVTSDKNAYFVGDCTAEGGEGAPVLLEWKDEDGSEENKFISHEIVCLSGDDANPENRAAALRKVIAQMEENAKRQEKVIAEMRAKLDAIEKEERKKK